MPVRFWPVEDLTVAGYADVLPETKRPAIVPPLFAINAQPGQFLVPPYHIHSGVVHGAAQIDADELRQFVLREEVTLFPGDAVFPARANHELWIDEATGIRYEPYGVAARNLDQIAQARLEEAEKRLREGELEAAEAAAAVAINANDGRLDPLAVMAAVARLQKRPKSERLMEKLAARHAKPENFLTMVERYVEGVRSAAVRMPPRRAGSPMAGMACVR